MRTIVDALNRAITTDQMVKRKDKGEWIVLSSRGTELRWVSNRQKVILTVTDIVATDWVCEEDEVLVSRQQVERALTQLQPGITGGKKEFMELLGFKWG